MAEKSFLPNQTGYGSASCNERKKVTVTSIQVYVEEASILETLNSETSLLDIHRDLFSVSS